MGSDYGDADERSEWRSRDKKLVSALSSINFPSHLKGITIGVSNEDGICDAPGEDDMESWLPKTEAYCEKNNIGVQMVEDLPLEMRMADFLRYGQVE